MQPKPWRLYCQCWQKDISHLQRWHEAGSAVEHAHKQSQRFLDQRVALRISQIQRMPQQPPQHALKLHTRHMCVRYSLNLAMHWPVYLPNGRAGDGNSGETAAAATIACPKTEHMLVPLLNMQPSHTAATCSTSESSYVYPEKRLYPTKDSRLTSA